MTRRTICSTSHDVVLNKDISAVALNATGISMLRTLFFQVILKASKFYVSSNTLNYVRLVKIFLRYFEREKFYRTVSNTVNLLQMEQFGQPYQLQSCNMTGIALQSVVHMKISAIIVN